MKTAPTAPRWPAAWRSSCCGKGGDDRRGRGFANNEGKAMRLRVRLQKLEQSKLIDRGCPACRQRRGQTTVLDVRRLPDGTVAYLGDAPKPCERRGVVPEFIVEVVV